VLTIARFKKLPPIKIEATPRYKPTSRQYSRQCRREFWAPKASANIKSAKIIPQFADFDERKDYRHALTLVDQ